MYFAAKHLELNQTKQIENGCEGAIKFLTSPGMVDPKRDVVCGAVVDSILDGLVTSDSLKQWVRWFYDDPRVGIDRYTTKFSDICPCSCTPWGYKGINQIFIHLRTKIIFSMYWIQCKETSYRSLKIRGIVTINHYNIDLFFYFILHISSMIAFDNTNGPYLGQMILLSRFDKNHHHQSIR